MKRRDFIVSTSAAGLGLGLLSIAGCKSAALPTTLDDAIGKATNFVLPDLGFDFSALAPTIDALTMEIHHGKHHGGYVKNLNAALVNNPLAGSSLGSILGGLTSKSADAALLNNAGGHYNHSLFWQLLTPGGANKPTTAVATALAAQFGSIAGFNEQFTAAAAKVFGSGWAWLILGPDKKLAVSTTANQENPLMAKVVSQPGSPLLGIDVWEHAYYLNYQNRRKDYIDGFMKLINWDVVGQRYASAMGTKP